jgi:hypothetical protein
MNLHAVSKLVAEHSSSPAEVQKKMDLAEQKRAIARTMFTWMTWGMIIMGIGIVLIMVNKSFAIGGLFRLFASLLTIAGMGVTVAGMLVAMKKGLTPPGYRPRPQLSTPAEPTRLPTNPIRDSLPSITEQTTRLLAVDGPVTKDKLDSSVRE